MKFDRAQLDAVGEVLNVAFGRGVAAITDPIGVRLIRKESHCDVLDEAVLRITLAQTIGTSGDAVVGTLSGNLNAAVAIVFKKSTGVKLVNIETKRPIDEIPASADAATETLRVIGSRGVVALGEALSQQFRAPIEAEQARVVRCHEAIDAVLGAIPPTLSRRTRDLVLISHALMSDNATMHGEILCVADCAGFSGFLRSCRLAA